MLGPGAKEINAVHSAFGDRPLPRGEHAIGRSGAGLDEHVTGVFQVPADVLEEIRTSIDAERVRGVTLAEKTQPAG